MKLFSFTKKKSTGPYKDTSLNLIYNLLFCDDLDLFKTNTKSPYVYPFDVLFSNSSTVKELQKIIDDYGSDTRVKILAYRKQLSIGHKPERKELLAVIIEVALDNGLDVLASFKDGTARYINQSGKIIIWEIADDTSMTITSDLFEKSSSIVDQIGVWDKPRLPFPATGTTRLTFLVSDGIYFGQGPTDVIFNDALANPALMSGTELMRYLTEKSLNSQKH